MKSYLTSLRVPGYDEFCDRLEGAVNDLNQHPEWAWALLNFHKDDEKYPLGLFYHGLTLEFSPITILYGSNGSGKSTILNLTAEILNIGHRVKSNQSPFFHLFSQFCELPVHSDFDDQERRCDIITSDDVFKHCFEVRETNDRIEKEQRKVIQEIYSKKGKMSMGCGDVRPLNGMDDFDRWSKDALDRRLLKKSSSAYMRHYAPHTFKPSSNGETALTFFSSAIEGAGVYLLDEPENSMSPAFQIKLVDFLENSARFFDMQFIIATHSPLVLGMKYAKIYNLDEEGAPERKWAELENIRILHDFFMSREDEFHKNQQ